MYAQETSDHALRAGVAMPATFDRLLVILAAASLGALSLLTVSHSAWALVLLTPLPLIWCCWRRALAADSNGSERLRAAISDALAGRDQPALRGKAPRHLHLLGQISQ